MSKESAPFVVIGLFFLGFILGVHRYSKAATAEQMQHIIGQRSAAETARAEAQSARIAESMMRYKEVVAAEKTAIRAAAVAALPGDPAKGKLNFMTCMACHGQKGEGMRALNTPRLAGQASWYLKRQLRKFKEGIRGAHPQDITGMQMAPMARLLASDEIIDNVIAYIATLDPDKAADRGHGEPAAGKTPYAICATCHGRSAEGMELQKAPSLTGQHAWYLAKQLKNFKTGLRGYHEKDIEGKLMTPMAQMLQDDKAINDLIAYIQSLSEE